MKKILLIRTGGTIGTAFDGEKRALNQNSKAALLENFENSNSKYAKINLFFDSGFPEENHTLSENMTVKKLETIARHINSFDLSEYSGVILLHGTDTLAFSASLFSFLFPNPECPILLVSGNRPPSDPKSNANANFQFAVESILDGMECGVFVPYLNSDGSMKLHRGARLMQCPNFSDDFRSICGSDSRCIQAPRYQNQTLSDSVLLIAPYTGLSYDRFSLDGVSAVVHGTYHSGTVCAQGNAPFGIQCFLSRCRRKRIPVFIAPSVFSHDQYESMFSLDQSAVTFLNMTTEGAYAKAIAALSMGLKDHNLIEYMKQNVAGEMQKNNG